MKVFDYIEKLNLFHCYALKENTGNAAHLAERIGVSRATIYNIINDLKSFEIDIRYSRNRETYYYEQPEMVEINLRIKQLNKNELTDIYGGESINPFKFAKIDKIISFVYGFR